MMRKEGDNNIKNRYKKLRKKKKNICEINGPSFSRRISIKNTAGCHDRLCAL